MKLNKYTTELESILSPIRLRPYLGWTSKNLINAFALYSLNIKLSGSFFVALHILEVSLRNLVNDCLMNVWGEKWYEREEITRE